MEQKAKRTRLSPVYLTATERDLVVQAMHVLSGQLGYASSDSSRANLFARSYTAKRIYEVAALFADKAPASPTA